jgi:hypothetical protein
VRSVQGFRENADLLATELLRTQRSSRGRKRPYSMSGARPYPTLVVPDTMCISIVATMGRTVVLDIFLRPVCVMQGPANRRRSDRARRRKLANFFTSHRGPDVSFGPRSFHLPRPAPFAPRSRAIGRLDDGAATGSSRGPCIHPGVRPQSPRRRWLLGCRRYRMCLQFFLCVRVPWSLCRLIPVSVCCRCHGHFSQFGFFVPSRYDDQASLTSDSGRGHPHTVVDDQRARVGCGRLGLTAAARASALVFLLYPRIWGRFQAICKSRTRHLPRLHARDMAQS